MNFGVLQLVTNTAQNATNRFIKVYQGWWVSMDVKAVDWKSISPHNSELINQSHDEGYLNLKKGQCN